MHGFAVNGSPAALLPAQSGERIGALDFIRGVAVMGIVLANIAAFGQPFSAAFDPRAFLVSEGQWDRWGWLIQLVLIDGKLRGLFTLLFGAGLVLFTDRAWAKGSSLGLQVRRLFWLFCFGAAHFILLWQGDILMSYAVAGLAVLPFLRWSGQRLLAAGIVGYVVGALALTALYGFTAMVARDNMAGHPVFGESHTQLVAAEQATTAQDRTQAAVIVRGDYEGFVRQNATHLPDQLGFTLLLNLVETVPLLLLGMGLYRLGFFTGQFDRRRVLQWSVAGLAAGGAVTALLGWQELRTGFSYFGAIWVIMGSTMLPRLPMILGLAGLLMLASGRARGWLGERVRAAGRMAFSNYLGTSFIMLWVFHGFGFGLFGELGRMELYGVALLMALAMLLWSEPWLRCFRYGPLEWAWRCLTYGQRFSMRR